jgi:RNA recognition motif. (a.k.a. RRM, RBD, or RNP domain)
MKNARQQTFQPSVEPVRCLPVTFAKQVPVSGDSHHSKSFNWSQQTTRSESAQLKSRAAPFMINSGDDRKVFFKGLQKKTTPEHLLQILSTFGDVVELKVPYSVTKQKNMGYGCAVFTDPKPVSELTKTQTLEIDHKLVQFAGYDFKQKKSIQLKLFSPRSSPTQAVSKEMILQSLHAVNYQSHSTIPKSHLFNIAYQQIIHVKRNIEKAPAPDAEVDGLFTQGCSKARLLVAFKCKPTSKLYIYSRIERNHLNMQNLRFAARSRTMEI